MIAPDSDVGDGTGIGAGSFGELRFRPVLVEPRHGVPAVARHLRRVVHGDQTICVARIANDEDAHVAGGVFLDCLSLADENPAVDAEQVFALHPLLARHAADEQCPVHAAKALVEIGCGNDAFERRKGAVVEFHDHAIERGQGGFDFNQVQNDRLVRAEHRAGSDAEKERVTDLSGGACDRHAKRSRAHNFQRTRV